MPRKKATAKTAKTTKKTTRVGRPKKTAPVRKQSTFASVAEYLKLGESYTSLVLGIIAVIIATVLLLSFVHTRQAERITPEVTPTIAQSNSFAISPTGIAIQKPTDTQLPTHVPSPTSTGAATQPSKIVKGKTYVVQAGDNLWTIAEKVYGSGYNWVDIAKANNLSHPDDIHVGNELKTPDVALKDATVQTDDEHLSRSFQPRITGNTYTVVAGDNLWGIALRAYGDGYQWVKIAKANNLSNPNFIHTGNTLKLPR